MLRRPPTSIELKLDDITEYEEIRQEAVKEQMKNSKSFNEVPNWQAGAKTKEEIYQRIGYVPPELSRTQPRNFTSY